MKPLNIIILLLYITVASCSKNNNDNIAIPELSQRSLEIEIGDIAQIEVLNVSKIDRIDAAEIVSTTVYGNKIIIEALSQGKCDIHITAAGKSLSCRVTINKKAIIEPAVDENINNPATRFCSPELELPYSIPGIIVTISSDTIEFRSLRTGDHAISTPQSLTINDKQYPDAQRICIKTDGGTKWYRHLTPGNQPVWVIISDL